VDASRRPRALGTNFRSQVLVERARRDARDLILSYHPDATIRWVCFENDLAKANRNCNERARRDPASFPEEKRLGDLAHNAEWTRLYCSPDPSIHGDQNIEFLPIRHADS
jgi:hypothetical protein